MRVTTFALLASVALLAACGGGGGGGGRPAERAAAPVAAGAVVPPNFNDADGDGVVTEAEFLAATDRLFAGLDRNGAGQATAADFAR